MGKLDTDGQRLLVLLVGILPRSEPKNPSTFITYKEVHNQLGLQLRGSTYGQSLKHQGLVSLADWTHSEKKPAITGLIVSESPPMPGNGYFSLFGKTEFDFEWWADQIFQAKLFDWTPYIQETQFPKAPLAADLNDPPERLRTIVYRILRDTPKAMRVKLLHHYECQICGSTINLPDGRYAEAHHIRPLGAPHNGPDLEDNILCLCPNHHAELDLGVRGLTQSELRAVPGHGVADLHLRYHNDVIHKPM